jgi:hypothetical protein
LFKMMRRISLLFLIAALSFSGISARPVERKEALEAARAFLLSRGYSGLISLDVAEEMVSDQGNPALYVISLEPRGWILVSADDMIQPVLAYSFTSAYDRVKGWTDAAAYLVEGYRAQIERVIQRGSDETHSQWKQMNWPTARKSSPAEYIDPFIHVNWNQSGGWNRFCPEDADGPGGHVYVGCVAVSMAQAMSVYGYPVKGNGIKSYVHETYGSQSVNFDIQEPYRWDEMSSSSPDDQNARLLYHCAVTVEMDFGPEGSGALTRTAAGALVRYFSYSRNIEYLDRYANEQDWINLLVAELSEGRPVIYKGGPDDGTSGHAWNVDGYGDGYFHMNFGWSGSYNGYYSLNLIDPGDSDYTTSQGAIIGIAPPVSGPYGLRLSSTEVDEQLPAGSYVADVIVEDEDPGNVYTFTCYGKWNPLLDDWGKASFYVENDTLRTDKVFEFNDEEPARNSVFLRLEVEDQYGSSLVRDFYISINKVIIGSAAALVPEPGTGPFFPNPADQVLNLRNSHYGGSVEICELATGRMVRKLAAVNGQLDISGIPEGVYLVVLRTEREVFTQKLRIVHPH